MSHVCAIRSETRTLQARNKINEIFTTSGQETGGKGQEQELGPAGETKVISLQHLFVLPHYPNRPGKKGYKG
ncbi:uncharacterized protein Dana_GF27917 [Drosophila ananassae]|uniref:Uncharacterized protein n=1 Tax=Drosophila ananassae TaxID=7217 RepID=A0A0P9CAK0_DROAN|nr:uncharacterized protein Dana_GF27917 [Drosophila ananassae]